MSLMKSVLPFLTNQTRPFSSGGIACSYFFGNFLLSSLLWYDFKILVKSRGGGKKKQQNFMAPFYGWGSTASRLQPLQGGSLFYV